MIHELEKVKKALESEKTDIQAALEEAEVRDSRCKLGERGVIYTDVF